MRSRRLLTLFLTLCLVLSALAPAAYAVENGPDAVVTEEQTQNAQENQSDASRLDNELHVSGEDAQDGPLYLNENPLYQMEVNNQNSVEGTSDGTWEFSPAENTPEISLQGNLNSSSLEELMEVAELYDKNEKVNAFVVMEGSALANTYSSRSQVSPVEEQSLIEKQNLVIEMIERDVLAGAKLNVRYQFTYLANAFSVVTEFKNLSEIAKMEGVKDVFVMPTFEPMADASPNTYSSGEMTGVHTVWNELNYTGAGMKIAVIDTGLDLDHPSFAADPMTTDDSMTVTDVDNVLNLLHVYDRMQGSVTAEELYRSTKVPFAFNYVDVNLTADHSDGQSGDHGTHVAGIAAANKVEGTSVVGMAPDAQVIVMKVFGAAGGAWMDDYVAAIEDAMTLGCDVVNLSLGSDSGFTESGYAFAEEVFANLEKQNIVATISAGNSGANGTGNLWGTDLNRTQNPENGLVGSPSTYTNAFSIASAENGTVMSNYFALADGTKVFYQPSAEALYGYVPSMEMVLSGDYEYVVIDGLGNSEDFLDAEGNSLVEGKVAVVKRGEINFSTKVVNAAAAGAVACLIWNNNPDDDIYSFGMATEISDGEYPSIPASLITVEDGQKMADAATKTMTVTTELAGRVAEGGQMSSFSSWGTTSDLRLLPDITGIGGNVYSCYDNGQYGLMSGTSMSAPQVAGVTALVMQYIKDTYPEMDNNNGEIREMAMALLMSTANPVISSDSGLEASPRQQGAGLVDADAATTSSSYLTVNGDRPKVEMKDSATGEFVFSFEIHNTSDVDQTYSMDAVLLTEDVLGGYGEYFMAGYERELTGEVDYGADTVTVFANSTATVNVRVTLSEEDKAYFAQYWENGGYVEGYIYLESEEDIDLNLPFFGFYGDWTDAPVFDTAMWYNNDAWISGSAPTGDQYYTLFWTSMGSNDWLLGFNPYSGATVDENGNIVYDSYNNVISPNGDGYLDELTEIYISLLRNAKEFTVTWKSGDKILQQDEITNVPKTGYNSSYGQVVPWVGSWYYDTFANEFSLAELADGTELTLTFDAKIDYEGAPTHTLTVPIYIDNTAPEMVRVFDSPRADGTEYLVIDVEENHSLAAVYVMNASGSRILTQVYDDEFEKQSDGTYRAYIDITGMGTEFVVAVCDYAANESYYEVTYEADVDGNLPVMDTSLLYGYRTYDYIIGAYYGSDHMYGWVSMNTPENDPYGMGYSWVTTETDDYQEYYSINAAEFAGSKIFAFDAGGNFLLLDPGLWERTVICETGLNVLDMAFDDTTDTMYVLAKEDYYTYLYTIDLLTCELNQVCSFGYYSYAPYAITVADDGTMYAVNYNKSYLYKVVESWGFYDTQIVTDSQGNNVELLDHEGNSVKPNYAQSMTFMDGKIYWAYFRSDNTNGASASLLTIDPSDDFSYTAVPFVTYYSDLDSTYYSDIEVMGLMSLEETEFQFPEGDEIYELNMNTTWEAMAIGDTLTLKANPTPWNYKLTDVTWASSDETVATVDEAGVVTAIGEGSAVITASHAGLTAECEVVVADIQGSFYGYDYMDYTGILEVNTADMEATVAHETVWQESGMPIAFIAGDYNGHDGCYYGYDFNLQFYKWDLTSGELTAIGQPAQINIADMAYDYTTGLLYVLQLDYMTGMSTIYMVDCSTGELIPYAMCPDALMTLAIDDKGEMYVMAAYGALCTLSMEDGADYGYDYYIAWANPIMENLGELNYAQSMTYDWTNDVILWANTETQNVYWLDYKAEVPYAMPLGCPSTVSMMQLLGMYTVPENVPELPDVAVESVKVSDMTMMSGATATAAVSIRPLNANGYTVDMESSNESVVTVTAGIVTAVAAGEADITVTVTDEFSAEPIVEKIHVTVIQSADNLYGYLSGDLATYNSNIWFQLPVTDTRNPIAIAASDYTVYAGEYYNGKLYAVGYNTNDYSDSNWYLLTMDPETCEIEAQMSLGEDCPFIYDMTYDYTTSTMYCVAGQDSYSSDLYAFNMETGELVLMMQTEPMLMSLAAAADGKLYAAAQSQMEESGGGVMPLSVDGYEYSVLYVIDPVAGTIEEVGSTGVVMNALSSMSYDYDTDRMYWTGMNQSGNSGGLSILDLETGEATVIDKISAAGASVTSLYFICDAYPTEDKTAVSALLMSSDVASVFVGNTTQLSAMTLPFGMDVELTWTSSDDTVATVDENGVVTGVAVGKADITATVTVGDSTMRATCAVGVLAEDAAFLTYNTTDDGWALINRIDGSVTQLTSGSEDADVTALTAVGNVVYGVDTENNLFSLDANTLKRNVVAALDADALITEFLVYNYGVPEDGVVLDGYGLEIRDLTYLEAYDMVLALGVIEEEGYGIYGGTLLCQLDVTTGAIYLMQQFGTMDGYDTGVQGMAMDSDGMLYFLSSYMDYYTEWDVVGTSERKDLYTLQRMNIHTETECGQDLYFDEATGRLYHLFSGSGMGNPSGTCYSLTSLGLTKMDLDVEIPALGEIDPETGMGDYFSGLVAVTEEMDIHAPVYEAVFKSGSTSLEGTIGLNFYLTLSEDLVNAADAKMVFTHNGKTTEVPASEAVTSVKNEETRYRFTMYLTSVEMADDVTAQMYVGDQAIGEAKTYSIQQYAMNRLAKSENDEEIALMKAMLNYGGYAQVNFGYNTGDLANSLMDAADQVLPEVTADDLAAYQRKITGSADGLKAKSATLLLESGTKVRIYFTLTGDKTIDAYTFRVDGVEVTPVEKDGKYYIETTGIKANELDVMHTFTADGITVEYGALSYVLSKLNSSDEAVSNMVKGLYGYSQAAEAYFA